MNIEKYGNSRGQHPLALTAFGAGLTSGAAVLEW
jgi:hypothetical protein